jgi:predicted O-methyltransferase YrrM
MDINRYLNCDIIEGHSGQLLVKQTIMKDLAKDKKYMMEIGFNAGHSADILLGASEDSFLVSFDIGLHEYVKKGKEFIDKKYPNRHKLILGSSIDTLPIFIKENPTTKFDLLFIDGAHNYDICKQDFLNCRTLASSNNVVIMDDVIENGSHASYTIDPTRVWKEGKDDGMIKHLGHNHVCGGRGFSWGKYIKKFIFCPVVNNFDLLEKAIKSVPPNLYDEYLIFNNSNSKLPIDSLHWKIINDERKTFRETQNIMREYAIENGFDWYSFMHNDGEITDNTAYRLVDKADKLTSNKEKWAVIFTHYDVFCAFSTECVNEIGVWGDEYWCKEQQSGYYLDNDYYDRMKLSSFNLYQLANTNVLHAESSNTIKTEEENKKWLHVQNQVITHYKTKWKLIKVPENKIIVIS